MWNIDFRYIQSWLQELSDDDYEQVVASLQVLEREGPALGRPLVDNIKYSTIKNLKSSGQAPQVKVKYAYFLCLIPEGKPLCSLQEISRETGISGTARTFLVLNKSTKSIYVIYKTAWSYPHTTPFGRRTKNDYISNGRTVRSSSLQP